MPIWVYPLVLCVAAGGVLLLTPLVIRLGERWNLVAVPGGRRRHHGRVVRIGGLGIYPAFAAATLVTLGIARDDPQEITRLTGILLSTGLVWILGLLDDKFELRSWTQLAGLLIPALVAIAFKVFIEIFNDPFTDQQVNVGWYLMLPITLVWLVGMAGTVNVLDGLDGLAAGVTGIAALVMFVQMLMLGQYTVSLLPLALVGCCLGFLRYNFYPARIFLGGGAYVLGWALGSISIAAGAKVASALLVLWLPVVDMLWQAYCRWRRGQPLGQGDRGHLHFRLQDIGWSQRRIVLLYYVFTALLGGVAIFVSSRLLKLGILVIIGLVIVIALALLARRTENTPPHTNIT